MAILKLKKAPKSKALSTKVTEAQGEKLRILADKHDITISHLISHLVEVGYLELTKNKSF